MSRRVNPVVILGLVIILVLSIGISASAQSAGGTAADAVAVGNAQLGKPHQFGAAGPDAFSCVGLLRYIMMTAGVDANPPWTPEAYLNAPGYTPVSRADIQPGDLVIFPDWGTMYVGNDMLLNSNMVDGQVVHTPWSTAVGAVGEPLGIVRPPYAGNNSVAPGTPAPLDSAAPGTPAPLPNETELMVAG
jgi:cell wall-associated NlpC family hydrolase